MIFSGHIGNGSAILASVTLCQVFSNVTGYFLHYCLGTALDTLASQSYGAKNYKYLGVLLQRSILFHLFLVIPISIVWINIENMMTILNQPPEIVHLSGKYMMVYILINPAYAFLFPCMKILQMQDIVLPSAVILVLANILEISTCYVLIFVADLGIYGAALGPVVAMYAIVLGHLAYIRMSSVWERIWDGFKWEALEKWGQYLYYGFPILVSAMCEIFIIEFGGFVIGMVSKEPELQISIYSILSYMDILLYMLPLSLATVTAIRVGNLVGEGKEGEAKKVGMLVVTTEIVLSLVQVVVVMAGHSIWGWLFSGDPRVVSGLSQILYILAIEHPLDGLVAVFEGLLRGIGKQSLALITGFAFCIFAFPMAIGLSVGLDRPAYGYRMGILAGYVLRAIIWLIVPFCCIKWNRLKPVDAELIKSENKDSTTRRDNVNSEHMDSSYDSLTIFNSSSDLNLLQDGASNKIYQTFPDISQKQKIRSRKEKIRLVITKLVLSMIFVVLFVLMSSCKFNSRRMEIEISNSYLKESLHFCCLALIPTKNISHTALVSYKHY